MREAPSSNQGNSKRQTHQQPRPSSLSTTERRRRILGAEVDLEDSWSPASMAPARASEWIFTMDTDDTFPPYHHSRVWHVSSAEHAVLISLALEGGGISTNAWGLGVRHRLRSSERSVPWTRTTHPSHHHSRVWHASSVGHAGLFFRGFRFDFLRHCGGVGKFH